jgi:acyl-CoA synthetase (NDP forming)
LATFVVPDAPQALAHLTEAGIPNFRTPESCADAIAAAFSRTRPRPLQIHPRATMGGGRLVNELQAYAILDRLGIPCAKTQAIDASSNRSYVCSIPFPVAVKLLSDRVAHKTEIGGVVLNVRNEAELNEAITRIKQSAQNLCPGLDVERFIAQQMVTGLGEVLIGYKIDPQVGPIVMLAAGGVMTEIYRDRSLRLAPVDLDVAREMIDEVKAMRAFTGFRGRPLGDLDALASAIMALSQLAVVDQPCVIEAEINPLIVMPKAGGVVAVDALIRLI